MSAPHDILDMPPYAKESGFMHSPNKGCARQDPEPPQQGQHLFACMRGWFGSRARAAMSSCVMSKGTAAFSVRRRQGTGPPIWGQAGLKRFWLGWGRAWRSRQLSMVSMLWPTSSCVTADSEQHFLMWRFLSYDPRQLRYLGDSQEWFGAGSGRSIWGRWWRFGSHSRACP